MCHSFGHTPKQSIWIYSKTNKCQAEIYNTIMPISTSALKSKRMSS